MRHPTSSPPDTPAELNRFLLTRKIEWMRELIAKQLAHLSEGNGLHSPSLLVPLAVTDREPMETFETFLCRLEEAVPESTIEDLQALYACAFSHSCAPANTPRRYYQQLLAWGRVFEPLQMNGEAESC